VLDTDVSAQAWDKDNKYATEWQVVFAAGITAMHVTDATRHQRIIECTDFTDLLAAASHTRSCM
jgi:hypothetical protein